MSEVGRKHPARGVHISPNEPTIVFLTVCTERRTPWLACEQAHDLLRAAWEEADQWRVGRYVLMPDHLHLFCAPSGLDDTLSRWVRYWKSHVSRHCGEPAWRWQRDFWDTRLRRSENYTEKWRYVLENSVRKGLATSVSKWPFRGVLHELRW